MEDILVYGGRLKFQAQIEIIYNVKLRAQQICKSSGCGWREGLQIRRVAANVLNKQSRTADKGWPYSLGVGREAKNTSP
jgi:hypothetical protein